MYIGRWANDSGVNLLRGTADGEAPGLISLSALRGFTCVWEVKSNAGVRLWVKESITSRFVHQRQLVSTRTWPSIRLIASPVELAWINEPCVSGFTRKILSCGRWSAVYHFNELSRTEAFGRVGFGPRQVQRHHKARWTVFLPPTSRDTSRIAFPPPTSWIKALGFHYCFKSGD